MTDRWTTRDIPDQSGRLAVVTGANSGLGAVAAKQLAAAGADVILACRDTSKGEVIAEQITEAGPRGKPDVWKLDLGDLASVRAFAERFNKAHKGLDLLVNNAGVMAPPKRKTVDGFEQQIGTNHLGHFALTGLLLPSLLARPDSRVVAVTSQAHRTGAINFDDLNGDSGYNRWGAYSQSKLANLVFAYELDRRAQAAGLSLRSVAAHPGYSATNLQSTGPKLPHERLVMKIANAVYAQSAEMGALPILYAATEPSLPGGSFIGPDGFMEGRGYPKVVKGSPHARDTMVAARLWEVSEELTGVKFDFRRTLRTTARKPAARTRGARKR
jgi:NAD(P)-dependent dehydrogenase (short-subunit alcohol dehydrogenase family)